MNLKRILKGSTSVGIIDGQMKRMDPFTQQQVLYAAQFPELPGLRKTEIVHTGNEPGGSGHGENSGTSGSASGADAAAAE